MRFLHIKTAIMLIII